MERELVMTFDGGHARCIYDDRMAPVLDLLGVSTVTRASQVEPYDGSGGDSFAARHAAGVWWTADMALSDGPVLGPFATRQAALDAERDWLSQHRGL